MMSRDAMLVHMLAMKPLEGREIDERLEIDSKGDATFEWVVRTCLSVGLVSQ